ncbi:hypothetical protein PAXRUDRAFT_30287 [Paxillus rubicundulus Ve08.2h10]|uniref:catalase n=1 Tax=Paxillus rubicundulus Ve08.2h10 TaxID=930991 RepID=A0A0D0DM46_9AGAM|nr:hypothetical protein PAXRUDRAFT_30287 [Paxillus rubicundulus Ve08.2h10]
MTSTAKVADLQRDTQEPLPREPLTTDHGVKVSDTDNWLEVIGLNREQNGPMLFEDQIGREKVHRFDHERILGRVVHARGAAAHGYFKVYDNRASRYTYAPVLTVPSRTTSVFVRFSTVQGSRGSAHTARDVRGFAAKFYTEEGNWDVVRNDIPVFFVIGQSAHNNLWDFVGLQPESVHMVMWVMSDRGIPRSFRMMQGFGVNTYTLLNGKSERHFVKFHFIPELGALKISGQDPDFHRKDLNEAIKNGAYPKCEFAIQTIPEAREHNFDFDILDATKVWPQELVPLEGIGELALNRVVDEFFPETEQITRLGINFQELPINRFVCPIFNHNRDGKGRHRTGAMPFELSHCDDSIVYRSYVKVLNDIDFDFAKCLAAKVGGEIPSRLDRRNHGKKSKGLSQRDFFPMKRTIVSRRIAILIADGFNAVEIQAVRASLTNSKAICYIIGPRRSHIHIFPMPGQDTSLGGQRSTPFDAPYIPSGTVHTNTLANNGRVVHWHLTRFVVLAIDLLRGVVRLPKVNLFARSRGNSDEVVSYYGVVSTGKYSASSVVTDVLQIALDSKGFVADFAYQVSQHRCYEREMKGLTDTVPF